MQCDVLLFAQLTDAIGCDRLTIQLSDGATAGDALNHLAEQYEPIASMRETIALAIDDTYVSRDTPVHDGATIALIPPVSGG